jgi:ABC-type cobalamin/Fe3+-siderophores transport system ATPase subunit
MELLRATDLTKRYGEDTAIAGVTFEVAAGEVLGIGGGPNGAGKTTLLNMHTPTVLRSSLQLGQLSLGAQRVSQPDRTACLWQPDQNCPLQVSPKLAACSTNDRYDSDPAVRHDLRAGSRHHMSRSVWD